MISHEIKEKKDYTDFLQYNASLTLSKTNRCKYSLKSGLLSFKALVVLLKPITLVMAF